MTRISFDLQDFKNAMEEALGYNYFDGMWYDQEEYLFDEKTGEIKRRIFRHDQYTDEKHPEWELFKILIKGTLEPDSRTLFSE